MQNKRPMQDFVVNLLNSGLSPCYHYHNIDHTLYVKVQALKIGKIEKCTPADLRLLEAAALWHDAGYLRGNQEHEMESCRLAGNYLPGFGFSGSEILEIAEIIMATKIPQSPKNKLGEILADADMEYLGTVKAGETASLLFQELRSFNQDLTESAWNRIQINFLEIHHYFTPFCIKNREPQKQLYLDQLLATLT